MCKCLVPNETNMCNFQSLEIVNRGSETQPQVVRNLNKQARQGKGIVKTSHLPYKDKQQYILA